MRKPVILLLVALLCLWLCPSAFAQSSIQTLDHRCNVNAGGTCDVNITVVLHLEEAAQPVFPIPGEAGDVTLNGSRGSVSTSGAYKLLSLSPVTGGNPGTFTFHIHYTLPGVLSVEKEGMVLSLPLLCGFAYPVDLLTFTVGFPSEVTTEPVFTSSYYQELIGAQMTVTIQGTTITGQSGTLQDHETLSMTLPVTDVMFPQPAATARVMGMMDYVMLGFGLLALIYFLLTMFPRRLHREARTTPPDGVSAGDLQMWLTGSGVDFSLLVVTWAQMGYLRIQLDKRGRVLLHKRMDMGNERSAFENRCFRNLFGPRQVVDGTGSHYARLCRSIGAKTPRIKEIYRPWSGNPKFFRGFALISGLLSGVLLASAFVPHSLLLKLFLAPVCAVLSFAIQSGGGAIPRRNRLPLLIGAGCALLWMLLGICSGEVLLCLLMILFQFFVGLGAVYGGRRTALGYHAMEQIFDLRRHLKHSREQDMAQLLRGNPNYFHDLAPYALALGADRTFARRFDRMRLQECSYLILSDRRHKSASEWAKALRLVVDTLDAKARQLPWERLLRR